MTKKSLPSWTLDISFSGHYTLFIPSFMDHIELIRSRIPIEELVQTYVPLKKSGRNWKGLCPFHQEKTPSFYVSPEKGFAYCFGCRKGGDIYTFLQEMEQVDFKEALKMLAERAGIELPKSGAHGASKEEKERWQKLLQEAHGFFKRSLLEHAKALSYLKKRGFDKKECAERGLGFSPDSFHQLTEHLKKRGFSTKEILDTGLGAQKEIGDSNVYDRFRNRIMFPIDDIQGKLVAFGGRTLSEDKDSAKYVNSPETKFYHKGSTLYLLSEAKKNIREKDSAVIVEGYFDALACHVFGFTNTVASCGTALTDEQVKMLGRFTKNLFFAFDADSSGQEAASRSIDIAQRLGFSVRIMVMPSGKDPDEAIREDKKSWEQAIEKAVDAMDYEFEKAFAQVDKNSLSGKKAVAGRLFSIIGRLPDQISQEFYLKKLSGLLSISYESLLSDFKRSAGKMVATAARPAPSQPADRAFTRLELLLGILANHPQLLEKIREKLKEVYFPENQEKFLYKSMSGPYNASELKILALYAEERYEAFAEKELLEEVLALTEGIRNEYKRRSLQSLRSRMHEQNLPQKTESLMKEYQNLLSDQF